MDPIWTILGAAAICESQQAIQRELHSLKPCIRCGQRGQYSDEKYLYNFCKECHEADELEKQREAAHVAQIWEQKQLLDEQRRLSEKQEYKRVRNILEQDRTFRRNVRWSARWVKFKNWFAHLRG